MKLKNKIAVITGGNSGIGFGVAKHFIDEGAKVALIGRDQVTLDQTVKELGPNSFAFKGDVTSMKDLDSFFQLIKDKYGKIDILFVNAGISKVAAISEVTEQFYDEIMNINVKGAFFTVQKAIPLMKPGSSIVMTSSTVAHKGYSHSSVYSASKTAVAALVKNFAAELVGQGIRVNAVSPGPIDTPIMMRSTKDPVGMKQMMNHVVQTIPMKRLGLSEEVAKAVMFFATDDSSFSTGAEILVDGGMINS